MKSKVLDFDPNVFLNGLDKLVTEEFSCFCLKSRDSFWDAPGKFARGFYEKLFGIDDDNDFVEMLRNLGYKVSTDQEMKEFRAQCLYLAYCVAKDIEDGKIENFVTG